MKTDDEYLARRIHQYRDAPRLEALIRARLQSLRSAVDGMPSLRGTLDDFTGDLLTKIGGILGFPRSHVVNNVPTVFGFGEASNMVIAGFGRGAVWYPAADFGQIRISIDDDDQFRLFLKAHILALNDQATIANVTAVAKLLWGDDAGLQRSRNGQIVIATGRELTAAEGKYWPIFPRLFPVPHGTLISFHEGPMKVFGFGKGWQGFREIDRVIDEVTGKVFGFDPDGVFPHIGGFGELAYGSAEAYDVSVDVFGIALETQILTTEDGDELVTEDGNTLVADPAGVLALEGGAGAIVAEVGTADPPGTEDGVGAAIYVGDGLYLVDENGVPIVLGYMTSGARICGRLPLQFSDPQDVRVFAN